MLTNYINVWEITRVLYVIYVFDLSNKTFTDHEIKLLSRGLRLVPKTKKIKFLAIKTELRKI